MKIELKELDDLTYSALKNSGYDDVDRNWIWG